MKRPDKNISILYLIDTFTKGSGTENQLQVVINNLNRSRFTPYLVILKDVEPDNVSDIDCEVLSLKVKKLFSFGALFALLKFIRILRKKRIKIIQIFFQDSNIFGVIAGRLSSIKNIIVSRRDMGWWYGSKYLKFTNIFNRYVRYCLTNAQAIKKQIIKYESFTAEQVAVIYNGINVENISNDVILKKELNIPDNSNVIGIVANLKPIKQIDLFLKVASLLNNGFNYFIIVGRGILEQELKTEAEKLGLLPNLQFYYTTNKINETIRLFDVGVLTSQSEGLSNVLIEYAINKVPAVAFDVGGNREIIIEGKSGHLIKPYDVEDMIYKIKTILDNRSELNYFDEETINIIKNNFSIKQLKQNTEKYYEKILGNF